ncbi:hypothetical protein AKJ16_DCAP08242, partial [Drosera capensis]
VILAVEIFEAGILGDLGRYCCTTLRIRFDLSMNQLDTHCCFRPRYLLFVRDLRSVEVFEDGVLGDLDQYCQPRSGSDQYSVLCDAVVAICILHLVFLRFLALGEYVWLLDEQWQLEGQADGGNSFSSFCWLCLVCFSLRLLQYLIWSYVFFVACDLEFKGITGVILPESITSRSAMIPRVSSYSVSKAAAVVQLKGLLDAYGNGVGDGTELITVLFFSDAIANLFLDEFEYFLSGLLNYYAFREWEVSQCFEGFNVLFRWYFGGFMWDLREFFYLSVDSRDQLDLEHASASTIFFSVMSIQGFSCGAKFLTDWIDDQRAHCLPGPIAFQAEVAAVMFSVLSLQHWFITVTAYGQMGRVLWGLVSKKSVCVPYSFF